MGKPHFDERVWPEYHKQKTSETKPCCIAPQLPIMIESHRHGVTYVPRRVRAYRSNYICKALQNYMDPESTVKLKCHVLMDMYCFDLYESLRSAPWKESSAWSAIKWVDALQSQERCQCSHGAQTLLTVYVAGQLSCTHTQTIHYML